MLALIKPFLDICLFRQGPQDLPASGILLGIAVAAHAATAVLLSTVSLGTLSAVLAGLLDTVLLCALTASLLYMQRLAMRVVQTLTAMAGSGAVITLVALPVIAWLHSVRAAGGDAGLAVLLLLVLLGWSLAVAGHILRHALSVPYFLGLVLAVVFYWISITVLNAAFPTGA